MTAQILSVVLFISFSYIFNRTMKLIESVMGRRWWYRKVYLRMPTWKFSRKVALLVHGKKCNVCGTKIHLDIDHKTYKHMWWEWLFVWDLQVLCRYHHNKKHNKRQYVE